MDRTGRQCWLQQSFPNQVSPLRESPPPNQSPRINMEGSPPFGVGVCGLGDSPEGPRPRGDRLVSEMVNDPKARKHWTGKMKEMTRDEARGSGRGGEEVPRARAGGGEGGLSISIQRVLLLRWSTIEGHFPARKAAALYRGGCSSIWGVGGFLLNPSFKNTHAK